MLAIKRYLLPPMLKTVLLPTESTLFEKDERSSETFAKSVFDKILNQRSKWFFCVRMLYVKGFQRSFGNNVHSRLPFMIAVKFYADKLKYRR
jgi:hypothetical protein